MAGPNRLTIRMYHVGFGDCFLLTFHYDTVARHLLIDFGTTRQSKKYMHDLADDISAQCGGKLDAVVATHRHKDHLSGFKTDKNPTKESSGSIIADLKPKLVSMTWTEDPELDKAATGPIESNPAVSFVATLKSMQRLAERAATIAESARKAKRFAIANELADLSEINIANKSALENLLNMAGPNGETEFLRYGDKTGLNSLFRGVRFHVLGPPTVDQWANVKKQATRDEDEYWHLANYWQLLERAFDERRPNKALFSKRFISKIPSSAKWLVDQLRDPTATDLLRISRVMDSAINNTSIILLIELWGMKMLFPGDAQIESWDYVLNGPQKERNRKLLQDVEIYKVGHHASLNGTPKTLWNLFAQRKDKGGELITLLSSRLHIHGKAANGSEVPRSKLVTALKKGSDLIATPYDIPKTKKFTEVQHSDLEIEFV